MEIQFPDLDGSPIPTGDPLLLAVNAFYAAFNERDITAMERTWASDGILYNPIGGVRRGWPEIARVYERLFSGPVRVRVSFHDYSLRIDGNMAFVAGRERGVAARGDRTVSLAIRTSRIFARTPDGWEQVHHHGSIDDPARLAEYQALFGQKGRKRENNGPGHGPEKVQREELSRSGRSGRDDT